MSNNKKTAIKTIPQNAPCHQEVVVLAEHFNQGRHAEAEASARRMAEAYPGYGLAWKVLGVALAAQGSTEGALAPMQRAVALLPEDPEAIYNLGNTLKKLGRLEEAETCYRRAIGIRPHWAEAHNNLGNTLKELGRLEASLRSCRRAVELLPDSAEALNNLGNSLGGCGRLAEADACYRRALEVRPDFAEARSNLIFTLDLMPGADAASQHLERRRFEEICAAPLYGSPAFANIPDPERRLRVGYVSADFREHSAATAFAAMLVGFDRNRFEVFAYSNSAKEDDHTRLFQRNVTCWRKIAGLSDAAVADLIREDGIDILVDLSGHSAGNRLLVFARKPAPIQITAWGYNTGTGMKAMDVLFSDRVTIPEEERHCYAEEVRYLPNALSAFFPRPFPEVNGLPALSGEGVTFGSFNRLAKVSEDAFSAWSEVLSSVPGSRMVLKAGGLDDPATREWVLSHFTGAGIAAERITLLGKSSWQEHVSSFHRIDIALDPFPESGGVTALEGFMMGIPLITLRWPTVPGRASASMLTTLGLSDWIAETVEAYVSLAVRKAQDLTSLTELRRDLRTRFLTSIIGDTKAYAAVVEQEYRTLWQEWCGRGGAQRGLQHAAMETKAPDPNPNLPGNPPIRLEDRK